MNKIFCYLFGVKEEEINFILNKNNTQQKELVVEPSLDLQVNSFQKISIKFENVLE